MSGCHVDPVWSPPGRKTQMVSLVTVFRMRCRGSFCAHGWHLRSPHQKSIFCKTGEAEYEWGLQSMFSSPPLGTSALRTRSTLFQPMFLFPGNTRACTQSAHWRTKDRMGSWPYNRFPWSCVLLAMMFFVHLSHFGLRLAFGVLLPDSEVREGHRVLMFFSF